MTDCGNYLIVMPVKEIHDNLLYFAKLNPDNKDYKNLTLIELVGNFEAEYKYVSNIGTKAIFRTNKNAPNFKLITIDLENFKENNWKDLIPEHKKNVLDWATAVDGNKLAVCYIEDVKVHNVFFIQICLLKILFFFLE